MMKRTKQSFAAIVALVVLSSALAGCAESIPEPSTTSVTISGSRDVLYDSLDAVKDDSAVVVTATVLSQIEPKEGVAGSPGTVSELKVVQSSQSDLADSPGQVFVFQYGTETVSAMAPLLKKGETYLLFLTSTGLAKARANDFFVTGSSAGIYLLTSEGYKRLGEDGDVIPALVTDKDALALLRAQ